MKRVLSSAAAPWSGLIAGMTGEALHHQILADMLHFDCRRGGAMPGLLWGCALVAAIAAAAALSWVARDAAPATTAPSTRRFISDMSVMAAAFFILAILWQTAAGFIVPACPS
jgi:hypothetical protein